MLALERIGRGGARRHHTTGRYRAIPFHDLAGLKCFGAIAFCALPVIFGFVIPFLVLLRHAFEYASDSLALGFATAAVNSLTLAAIAASITALLALTLAYARRVSDNTVTHYAVRFSGLGYAIPGTVLALGLMFPMALFDSGLGDFVSYIVQVFNNVFGLEQNNDFRIGLVLSGSISALVLAYAIRFLTVSLGSTEAGLERISPNLDAAARTLGESPFSTLVRVHLPMLVPALGAAALLVFVDAMKELPATLLLRPFNFETLATHVFALAQNEQFEEAALGSLAIVVVGLIPVLFLHKAITSGRPGS